KRRNCIVLAVRLTREAVELGPRAGEGFEEAVGPLVAMARKLGEALVDERKPSLDLRDHPLRVTLLLGDTARQPFEGRVGMIDIGRESFRSVCASLSDSGRRLLNQSRYGCRLGIDARPDFLERGGRAL